MAAVAASCHGHGDLNKKHKAWLYEKPEVQYHQNEVLVSDNNKSDCHDIVFLIAPDAQGPEAQAGGPCARGGEEDPFLGTHTVDLHVQLINP